MTWFKVDDQLHAHPKVLALFDGPCPGDALGLWVLAGSWCADQLTDGYVPMGAVRRLGFAPAAAEELVRVGLWLRVEAGGFVFHDWADRNPSRADVEAKRAKTRDRVRKHRDRAPDSDAERNSVTEAPGNVVTSAPVTPTETALVTPPPTRPDPTRSRPDPLGGGSRAPARDGAPPHDSDAAAAELDRLALASKIAMRRAIESVGGIYDRDDRPEHTAAGRDVAAWAVAEGRALDDVLAEWASDWIAQAERRSARSWSRYVADRAAGAAWGSGKKPGRLAPGTGEGFDEVPEDPDELAQLFTIKGRRAHG